MKKSIKWAYWGLISLSAVSCIINLVAGLYWPAYTFAACAIFLFICYKSAKIIALQNDIIKQLMNISNKSADIIKVISKRESIAKTELNKMRQRAEKAEKELANLPIRDSLGRFAKRIKS